jgi:hypothetical protein
MLDYEKPDLRLSGPEVALRLTVFFFGGFLSVMFTFACAAVAVLTESLLAQFALLILCGVGGLVTLRCSQMTWKVLRGAPSRESLMDLRLKD